MSKKGFTMKNVSGSSHNNNRYCRRIHVIRIRWLKRIYRLTDPMKRTRIGYEYTRMWPMYICMLPGNVQELYAPGKRLISLDFTCSSKRFDGTHCFFIRITGAEQIPENALTFQQKNPTLRKKKRTKRITEWRYWFILGGTFIECASMGVIIVWSRFGEIGIVGDVSIETG